jgi:hypothetical protein
MDKTLKYIVDNVRVCVDGKLRIKPVPQPAADATRPIALRALLRAIDAGVAEFLSVGKTKRKKP